MAAGIRSDWEPAHSVLFAHVACLCLGVGMILWGLAPAVVAHLVTRRMPDPDALLVNSLVFMLGVAFLGMHVLVRRGVLWAAWAAFLLSALIAAAGLALLTVTGIRVTSSFLLLLSSCTCFATWLAIATLSHNTRAAASQKADQPRLPHRR